MTFTMSVSVALFREGEVWVAQGLEYDIAAHGESLKAAKDAFVKTFAGQIAVDIYHGDDPLAGFSPAPLEYWG